MTERPWGKSRLRRAAEKRGYLVSNPQFNSYVAAGLIPPGEGRAGKLHWSPEVVDLLCAIRALSETVRPLPRRVIVLYPNDLFHRKGAPSDATLWAAIREVLPTIDAANAKLERILLLRPDDGELPPDDFSAWITDEPKMWAGVLRIPTLPLIQERIQHWYDFANDPKTHLADIPYEERVVLFAVADLHLLARKRMLPADAAGQWLFNRWVTPGLAGFPATAPPVTTPPAKTPPRRKAYGIRKAGTAPPPPRDAEPEAAEEPAERGAA